MKVAGAVMVWVLASLGSVVPAWGGMGPTRGLPSVDLWGTNFAPNQFSAVCVGCHTENPSSTAPFLSPPPFGEPVTSYVGSHFVRNELDGSTHLTANLAYEKLVAWGGSGAFSRYGDEATGQSVTGVSGQMLCGSCHNLVSNVLDSINENHLLLDVYDRTTGEATLCEGCHTGVSGASHHPLGNVDNSARGGVRGPVLPTDTDGVGYFAPPNVITCLSCHKVHQAQTATGARMLRRGRSSVAILGVTDGPVNVVYYAGLPDAGSVVGEQTVRSSTGLHRQSDMLPGTRLVTNADPLCDVCHLYNDL